MTDTPALRLRKPYLLFTGDIVDAPLAKTAFGLRDWAPDDCVGQWRMAGSPIDLGLPDMTAAQAASAGAQSLLIGVAVSGGRIPDHWLPLLLSAIAAGMDIVSGLHTRLTSIPALVEAAAKQGTALIDIRVPPTDLPTGTGTKRRGKRLLTVGSDCALGKKYTALTLARAMQAQGIDATFRATGQTGILIAGSGVPLDAVVADFIAGAAESLSPDAADDHWDVIEGQGSLIHPAFAGVTTGLVHGSQPDAMILCHDPARVHILKLPHIVIPPLPVLAERYVELAQLTNPKARVAGVSLNTAALDEAERARVIGATEDLMGLPCFDPLLTPADAVIASILNR